MELKEKVEAALKEIGKFLAADGGGCELVEVEGSKVTVRLKGACSGCPFAMITLKTRIEKIIKERVPEITEVVSVE
ncbi:MAG: NifU family protein [Candidatus Ratteibacteria bacterium]|jgi:Fe-S cluster biogenesis protein NfuA